LIAPDLQAVALDAVDIAVEPWHWPFALARRADIDRHFDTRRRAQPALWNGRVLLLRHYAIENGVLRGTSFETDYASFVAWRDWDCPKDAGAFNIFGAAALRAADGAYLIGRMAPSTSIAGQWLFPCGTPDPKDIDSAGKLDLAGSVGRELGEETGLDIDALTVAPGWTLMRDGGYIALMRGITATENADLLRARILRHLAGEAQPEFSEIRVVRGAADIDPATPRFLVAYLENEWRGGNFYDAGGSDEACENRQGLPG
jgi:8-oxo-dGTP pyrophosphatase MutT (NUDIX family)